MDKKTMQLLIKKAVQAAEIRTPLNIEGTRKKFCLEDDAEIPEALLLLHYAKGCPRAKEVGEVHSPENLWATGEEIGCDPTDLSPEEMEQAIWDHYCKYHPEVVHFDGNLLPTMRRILSEALEKVGV